MARNLFRYGLLVIALALPLAGCLEPWAHDLSKRTSYQSQLCALGKYDANGDCAVAPAAH